MFEINKKRLTIEDNYDLSVIMKKNPKITQAKIGLDFSAKFKRPISKQCVCNIIQQKKIKAFDEADPGLEIKKQETHVLSRK